MDPTGPTQLKTTDASGPVGCRSACEANLDGNQGQRHGPMASEKTLTDISH